jgi:hypothetical protein
VEEGDRGAHAHGEVRRWTGPADYLATDPTLATAGMQQQGKREGAGGSAFDYIRQTKALTKHNRKWFHPSPSRKTATATPRTRTRQ